MNPEKFKVSALGETLREALAAYDSKYLSVGAMDVQTAGVNGRKRTVSWTQVIGVSPSTKQAFIS